MFGGGVAGACSGKFPTEELRRREQGVAEGATGTAAKWGLRPTRHVHGWPPLGRNPKSAAGSAAGWTVGAVAR